MIVSEIEMDTPDEWLEVLAVLTDEVDSLNDDSTTNSKWDLQTGMTKHGWYIEIIAEEKNDEEDL